MNPYEMDQYAKWYMADRQRSAALARAAAEGMRRRVEARRSRRFTAAARLTAWLSALRRLMGGEPRRSRSIAGEDGAT